MELAHHLFEVPVLLLLVQLVGADAGYHVASVGVLAPVTNEGVEVVAGVVDHGEHGIHDAPAHPLLCLLVYGVVGIPAITAVACHVVVLAQRSGAHAHPGLEALDLARLNDDLKKLIDGQSVEIPRYDFITGTRQSHEQPLQLDDRSVLIMEGIHALNPRLTPALEERLKFKIYLSCFTSVAMDNITRIHTTDNRLLRRITRDYRTRGNNAYNTIARWPSVRRGEEKHIFPYQENADVMVNTSLFYELGVIRPIVEPILREIPDTVPEYGEAHRLLEFLDNFVPIAPDEIPLDSVLREFVGGSSFKY